MTLPAGHLSNLLTGLATFTAGGGIEATYSTSGAYTALQTGIVLGDIPQKPDRIIALTVYDTDNDPGLSDSVIFVQVRCRAEGSDKRKVDDLDAAVFGLWHGATHVTLTGGVHVVQIEHLSGPASLGQDGNHLWSVSSNYAVTVHRPSANRI